MQLNIKASRVRASFRLRLLGLGIKPCKAQIDQIIRALHAAEHVREKAPHSAGHFDRAL
jgi:hypothetical protein